MEAVSVRYSEIFIYSLLWDNQLDSKLCGYVVYYIIKIQVSFYFCRRDYDINKECQSPSEDITNDVRKCEDQTPDSHLGQKEISNAV